MTKSSVGGAGAAGWSTTDPLPIPLLPLPGAAPRVEGQARFTSIGELARGGHGRVLVARDEVLRRQVALKLPLRSDSANALRRFEREALLTAALQHPGIVSVYDLLHGPTGEQVLVMRRVEGRPFDRAIGEAGSLEGRVALLPAFIAACDAIAYAHRQGVIHRDIKPSNVLLGDFGDTVVIDWGLAKELGAPADDEPAPEGAPAEAARGAEPLTAAGAMVGTPGYMSPEQARGEPVDARSDVYALGAMLYQLLAGQPPYAGRGAREVLELARSAAPTPLPEIEPGVAPELATIVARAMAREKEARYASAAELAEELKLFQTGRLVRSHAYSAWQLVRRWARRHAAILAVSGACLALLAAGAVVSVRRIVAEKERANREAATARSVSDFMSDMFKVSNPGQGRGETVTAREILDQAAQRIESGLARDPQVQGRLMLEIGTVYSNLGLYPEAERLLEKAAHTLAQQLGADSRPAVEALVVWAAELQRASKLADAEKLALDARERAVRVFGPRDPVALSAANELALVYFRERRLEESERIGRAALADARATLGADDPLSVKLLSNLGNTCKLLGRPDTEALFEEAVAVSSRVNGPDSLPALMALNNLAGYHRDNGKPEKALELQRQVLEGMRRTLGPDHPTTLIVARNVAAALESLGRYAEMEPYVREALRGREARLGPDNLHTLESVADLGVLLVRLRRFDEAAPLLERALAGYRRVQAATPGPVAQRNVALALCNLADLAAQRGDTERALAQLREALGAGLSPAERRSALEEDELLAPLRSDARFQALVAEAKAGAPAK